MKRTARNLTLAGGLCFLLALAGCGNSSSGETAGNSKSENSGENSTAKTNSTPEKTLAAIKALDEKREYDQFCQHFTADAKQVFAGGLWMSSRMLMFTINNPDFQEQADERDKALVSAIEGVLTKHKVNKAIDQTIEIPAIQQVGGEQPAESKITAQQQVLHAVGKQIEDPCQFVTDCIQALRAAGSNPDARMFEEDARLEKLTIENNHAEAELVFTREGREIRRPVGFEKASGTWKFSRVPDVLYK